MIGKTISHYRILEKLGGGGMAVVCKAEDTKLHRLVALEFLGKELSKDCEALERFQRDTRAAAERGGHALLALPERGGRIMAPLKIPRWKAYRTIVRGEHGAEKTQCFDSSVVP